MAARSGLSFAKYFCLLILLPASFATYGQEIHEVKSMVGLDRTLIPEGIEVDPKTKIVYVSAVAGKKIVQFGSDGKQRDFIVKEAFGYQQGVGMKIDTAANILWTLSNNKNGNTYTSKVIGFQLRTGSPVHAVTLTDSTPHLLNDLVIVKGTLFITDSQHRAVYKVQAPYRKAELLIRSPLLEYANGITATKHNSLVIATSSHGLMVLNLSVKSLHPLVVPKDPERANGIDGLLYRDSNLWGLSNSGAPGTNGLVRYTLDPHDQKIIAVAFYPLREPPYFDPTTFAIDGSKLYIVANSHLTAYNKNNEKTAGIESVLTPVNVRVLEIKD